MALPRVVQLIEFQSGELFERETRGAGTYIQVGETKGNSILSSVFIESIDPGATLKINYYDTTTGAEVNERYDLTSHDLITDAIAPLTTVRILVTRIHHRVVAEAIVSGGSVRFSLYATVVSSTASDLDNSLVRDGDTFFPLINKGIPIVCLNEGTGELEFIRCPLPVSIVSAPPPGTPFYIRGKDNADPGDPITIFSQTVPSGITRHLHHLWVTAYNDADFSLQVDGVEVAAGRIVSTVHQNVSFSFVPPRPISPGAVIELIYTSEPEPNYPCPVTAFLSGNDVPI